MDRSALALIALVAASLGREVHATPRAMPFTYPYGTLARGDLELEQYVDLVPARVTSLEDGNPRDVIVPQLQTELEYGISNRVEAALYVTLTPSFATGVTPPSPLTERTGAKQRLRVRLFEEGKLPLDVAVYAEVVENNAEIELEGKVILARRFGRLEVATNLWCEREYYFDGRQEWVFNPTLGANVEIAPWLRVGAESWLRVEYPDRAPASRPFSLGPHVYAGPTVLLSLGRLWWSLGTYARATDLGRSPSAGDSFGALWIRSLVGVSL